MTKRQKKTLRIVLADDHAMLSGLMQTVLELQSDLSVVGRTRKPGDIIQMTKTLQPDVLIMDMVMPALNPSEVLKGVREFWPKVHVLIVTGCRRSDHVRLAMESGAAGLLFKQMPAQELIRAVRTIADGGVYFDQALSMHCLSRLSGGSPFEDGQTQRKLSDREEHILRLSARGFSYKEIAEQVGLTPKAVEMAKARAFRKLNLVTRHDLVQYASNEGWFENGQYEAA